MKNYIGETDEGQRERIKTRLDLNMFVEAGAGAGKTTLIVERVMRQLLEADYEPGQIVVITFTRAAAEELRGRIIGKLQEEAKTDDEKRKEKAGKILQNIDKMQISTIHHFCTVLLRERCFDAKLPVGFTVLEEGELKKRKEDAFKEWEKQELNQDAWDELLKYDEKKSDYSTIQNYIKKIYDALCGCAENITEDNLEYRKDYFVKEEAELMQKAFDFFDAIDTKILQKNLSVAQPPAAGKKELKAKQDGRKRYQKVEETVKRVKQNKAKYSLEEIINEVDFLKSSGPINSAIWDDDKTTNENARCDYEAEYDKVSKLKDEKKKLFKQEHYIMFVRYAIKAWNFYRAGRRNDEVSNDQLLSKTKELLENNPEARAYFAKKFRCIYVDEFQDTDRIQKEFIWKLAEDGQQNLRDGALFLVGDPKQSIYRFRGAEPQVYFDTKQEMEGLPNAEIFLLSKNFRSNNRIVEWVNQNFCSRPLTNEPYEDMEHHWTVPASSTASGQGTASEEQTGVAGTAGQNSLLAGIYTFPETEGRILVEEDAGQVCNLIQNLVREKYRIMDKDTVRDVRYGDFLVLTHNTLNLKKYMKAFSEAGIPVVLFGKMKVDEEKALLVFLRLYKALVCRKDRYARVGAIEAMKSWDSQKQDKKEEEYYETLFEELCEATKTMGTYGIADYLVHHPEWIVGNKMLLEPITLLSLQTKLQQMLEVVTSRTKGDGNTLADAFETYLENELEKEFALEERMDAVRLMNVHKAKGLEGSVVIWANRKTRIEFRKEFYQKWDNTEKKPKKYISFKTGSQYYWCSYEGTVIEQEARTEYDMEICRLEYVAATRAKQALIFMNEMEHGESEKMFSRKCSFDFGNQKIPEALLADDVAGSGLNGKTAGKYHPVWKEFDETEQAASVFEAQSPSGLEKGSPTRQKALAEKKEAEALQNALRGPETVSGKQENERPVGNIVGNALHRCLELLVSRRGFMEKKKLLEFCVTQAVLENRKDFGSEEMYKNCWEFLKVVAENYAEYTEKKQWFSGTKVYTEYPFSYCFTGEDGKTVWMNGIADLLLEYETEGEKRIWIVDYKSDSAEYLNDDEMEQSLREKYEPQLLAYREAAQKLFLVPEEKICGKIVYFRNYDKETRTVETKLMQMF